MYRQGFGSMEGLSINGENVAMYGPSSASDAEAAGRELAEMWWNSSGHRANMLGNYKGLGVGVYRTASGEIYGTQIFYNADH